SLSYAPGPPLHLPSSPTRRSSDLAPQLQVGKQYANTIADKDLFVPSRGRAQPPEAKPAAAVPPPSHLKLVGVVLNRGKEEALFRSEEHTSELQSLTNLVCRLLLDK